VKNQTIFNVVKNVFYGLILLVVAGSTAIVFANIVELLPIVDTPDLPVCDIETLESN